MEKFSRSIVIHQQAWRVITFGLLALVIGGLVATQAEFGFLLFIILIFVLLGVIYSILYERFAIYLLALMLPLAEMLRVDILPTTLLVFPGALAVLGLLASFLWRAKKLFFANISLFYGVLLTFWATLAMTIVGSVGEARPYWLVFILLFLLPNLLTRKEHLLRTLWLIIVPLGLVGAYVAALQASAYFTGAYTSIEDLHNTLFAVGNKNIVAMWMTMGLSLIYYMLEYYRGRPRQRFILFMVAGAMFLGYFFTISIGGTVGLIVMAFAISSLQRRITARLRILVFGLLVGLLIFSGPLAARLENQNLTSFDANWGTYRGELWLAGIHTIEEHPVFGIGLQQARRIELVKHTQSSFIHTWHAIGIVTVPHNIFLSVAVDTGLPGLIFYLGMLISIIWALWKIQTYRALRNDTLGTILAKGLLVALITGWVQGLGLSVHLDKLTWFLMGSAIALSHIVSRDQKHEP